MLRKEISLLHPVGGLCTRPRITPTEACCFLDATNKGKDTTMKLLVAQWESFHHLKKLIENYKKLVTDILISCSRKNVQELPKRKQQKNHLKQKIS